MRKMPITILLAVHHTRLNNQSVPHFIFLICCINKDIKNVYHMH